MIFFILLFVTLITLYFPLKRPQFFYLKNTVMHFLHTNEKNLAVSVPWKSFKVKLRGFVKKNIFPRTKHDTLLQKRVSSQTQPHASPPMGAWWSDKVENATKIIHKMLIRFSKEMTGFSDRTLLISLIRNTWSHIQNRDISKNKLAIIFKNLNW